jgi:hypothetical protein
MSDPSKAQARAFRRGRRNEHARARVLPSHNAGGFLFGQFDVD